MKLRAVWMLALVPMILSIMLCFPVQAEEVKCGDWSAAICREYGCQTVGCLQFGGKVTAEGMVMNPEPLKRLGFSFGGGPYKAFFERLNPGRYVITLQSMTRPRDRQEKMLRMKTAADAKYPRLPGPAAEPGKYTWDRAIDYDLERQLGLKAHYELYGQNVSFVDLRVVNPKKLAEFGFPLLPRDDTKHQLIYKGRNRWQLSSRHGDVGPRLMYDGMEWSESKPHPLHGRPPGPGHPPGDVTGPEPPQPPRPVQGPPTQIGPLPIPLPIQLPIPIPGFPGSGQPSPPPSAPAPPPPPSVPRPNPPDRHITLERNVERPGEDYRGFALDQGDPNLCAQACEDEPLCRAFTYYRPGLKAKKAFCTLKRTVPPKKMNAGCYSGVKDTAPPPPPSPPSPPQPGPPSGRIELERNVERPGGSYKNFVMDQGEPGLCAHACEQDPLCRAFTYYRPGLQGAKAFCSLKRVVPQKKMKAGCYSGVKETASSPAPPPPPSGPTPATPPPPSPPGPHGKITTLERNVERPGGDYKHVPLDRNNPDLCVQECEQDPLCRAFTYYRPGLKGPKASCSLKKVVTPKKIKDGCYSGVKE